VYAIIAAGAGATGGSNGLGGNLGQRGLVYLVEARLTMGETILILVGQQPLGASSGAGGTFVVRGTRANPIPIVIAGGAGGRGETLGPNDIGVSTNGQAGNALGGSGTNPGGGGTNGGGGGGTAESTGGGGLLTNGGTLASPLAAIGGRSFVNGGTGGGRFDSGNQLTGGFGGGGGAWTPTSCSGGGGNTGGGGASMSGIFTTGGGGGSITSGGFATQWRQENIGDGYVTITLLRHTHFAMHSAANNASGDNDGSLLSIPLTTTAMTTRPTYVSAFTPAASPFSFNLGDQIRIRMNCPTGGQYWSTPHGSFLGELGGSLVCTSPTTPNSPTPSNLGFAFGATPVTVTTLLSQGRAMPVKTIVTGFQLNGFLIATATTPVIVQVDIFNNNSTPTQILQVFFSYIETSTTATPLYIPFSYAEYDRFSRVDSSLISRIVPTSLYYVRPQNPMFNAGDLFQIQITSVASMSIFTHASGNISGGIWGITLTTPIVTFPNIADLLTPIFNNRTSNTPVVNILAPTSNSAGAFAYAVSPAQLVNTATTDTSNGQLRLSLVGAANPSVSVPLELITAISVPLTITALQRSTTTPPFASNSVRYPNTIDYINTNPRDAVLLYTTSPPVVIINSNWWNNGIIPVSDVTLNAYITRPSILRGFSFQYVGGYTVTATTNVNVMVTVIITRYPATPATARTIAFRLRNITSNLNGSMAFIPFDSNILTTRPSQVMDSPPPSQNGITYDDGGTTYNPIVSLGDLVQVRVQCPTGVSGLAATRAGVNVQTIFGSLVTIPNPNPTGSVATETIFPGITLNISTVEVSIYNSQLSPILSGFPGTTNLLLRGILVSFPSGGLGLTPTIANPIILHFRLVLGTWAIAQSVLATTDYIMIIRVVIISGNVTSMTIPFNMPVEGEITHISSGSNWYIDAIDVENPGGSTAGSSNRIGNVQVFSFPVLSRPVAGLEGVVQLFARVNSGVINTTISGSLLAIPL
jgi:hypothetical protein